MLQLVDSAMAELKDWFMDWSWKDLTNYLENTFNSITKEPNILLKILTINVNKVIRNYYFIKVREVIETTSIRVSIIKVIIIILIDIYSIEINHFIQLKDYWIIKNFRPIAKISKSKDSNYCYIETIFDF